MLADKSFYTFNQQQTGRKKNTLFKELEKAKIFNRCNTVSHLCVDPIIMVEIERRFKLFWSSYKIKYLKLTNNWQNSAYKASSPHHLGKGKTIKVSFNHNLK